MARNQIDFAISIYCKKNNVPKSELAFRLGMSAPSFYSRIRDESFTDFELNQLKQIGVNLTVSYI
jgi:hypothetical protein